MQVARAERRVGLGGTKSSRARLAARSIAAESSGLPALTASSSSEISFDTVRIQLNRRSPTAA
jgi:hypothetical protein